MFKRILVPTDGSELSAAAAQKAIAFAKSINATICGFYGVPESTYTPSGVEFAPIPDRVDVETIARSYLSVIEGYAREAGVPCECFFEVHESPYRAIIQAAETHHCDLIFMGSHGRGAMSSLIMGSVTQQVMSHSYIPVLVYRDDKIAGRMKQVIQEARHYRI